MKARSLALLAVLGVALACEEHRSAGPGRGPSFEETDTPPASPTPVLLREGEYSLALAGTGSLCGFEAPPETIYLAGAKRDWQVATQPGIVDVQGVWNGTNLALAGGARRIYRPTIDCVVEETSHWSLYRDRGAVVSSELAGTITFARRISEGEACDQTEPKDLPCKGTRSARMAFVSLRRAPKVGPYNPVPDTIGTPLRIEKFRPSLPDPEGEPTSAPDLLRAAETPTPRSTPVEIAKPKPTPPTKKPKPKKPRGK